MITIKSEREISLMRQAGMMVSKTHKYLQKYIKPGITTRELDTLAENYIRSMGGLPTCKGYEGFPATLCTSPEFCSCFLFKHQSKPFIIRL